MKKNFECLQSVFSEIPNEGYRMHMDMDGMKTTEDIMAMMFAKSRYVWLLFILKSNISAQTYKIVSKIAIDL
ncbi:hypothetical protein [Mangrovibacterium marinum]|uniref:Uncharacterized protein n=1 Tax=Mangrovibacterium marinum TaxID=1639118 RepID=A0A2T5BY75_9BACT|nr:hypothetical protein [Mangrovibacterium marinum]PTN06765.1 hypothetical protein C8N47_12118 [Mangrovibacterium marinum]